jgi:peptide deformylase
MVVPIVIYGSPVLRKHSIDIVEEDDLLNFNESLTDTLKKAEGIGLAGPQIGILKRIFVIDTSPLCEKDTTAEKFEKAFLNPGIVDRSKEVENFTEGCLSLPGIYEDITRPKNILVRYQDLAFNTIEEELHGIKARIFQHEYDHLQGILFIDRLSPLKKILIKNNLKELKNKYIN